MINEIVISTRFLILKFELFSAELPSGQHALSFSQIDVGRQFHLSVNRRRIRRRRDVRHQELSSRRKSAADNPPGFVGDMQQLVFTGKNSLSCSGPEAARTSRLKRQPFSIGTMEVWNSLFRSFPQRPISQRRSKFIQISPSISRLDDPSSVHNHALLNYDLFSYK